MVNREPGRERGTIALGLRVRQVYRATVPKPLRDRVNSVRRLQEAGWKAPARWLYDPVFRNRRDALRSLAGMYDGQRCVVMGNGPSLNRTDLALLRDEYVWASNRAYLLFDRIDWRPSFWVAVDRRVTPDISPELTALQAELPDTQFFFPDDFLLKGTLQPSENTYWFTERHDTATFPEGAFSFDVAHHVAMVSTVTITALQLAVHLGFNPIYLIGCDTSYVIPSTATVENGDERLLLSTEDDDPNHFDRRYFGAGRKWHNPYPERMVKHYEAVRRITEPRGIRIVNLTVGGSLEAFDRQDYEEVFPMRPESEVGS